MDDCLGADIAWPCDELLLHTVCHVLQHRWNPLVSLTLCIALLHVRVVAELDGWTDWDHEGQDGVAGVAQRNQMMRIGRPRFPHPHTNTPERYPSTLFRARQPFAWCQLWRELPYQHAARIPKDRHKACPPCTSRPAKIRCSQPLTPCSLDAT